MSKQILNRRDTAANWSTINPILGPGEIGVESDSGQFKLGDGTSTWSELDYFGAGGGGGGGGGSLITNPAKTYTVGAGGDFANFTELVEFFLENRNASNWEYSGNGRYRATHTTIDLQGAMIDLGNETFAFDFFSGWLRFINGGITNGTIYFTECWVRFSETFIVDCSLQFNGGFAFDEYGYAEDRWTADTSLTVTKGGTLIVEGGSPFNGGRISAFDNGMFIFSSEISSFIEAADVSVNYGSWGRIAGDVICGLNVERSSELNVEGDLTIRGPKRGTIDQNSHVFVRDNFQIRSDGTSASLDGVYFKVRRNSGLYVSGTVDLPGGTGAEIPVDIEDSSILTCDIFDVSSTGRTKVTVDRTSELHILDNESFLNRGESIYHRPNLPTAYPTGQASAETQIWSDNGVMVIGSTGVATAVGGALGSDTATADQVLSWDGSGYVWITPYGDADVDLHVNQPSAVTGQILSWNGTDYEWVSPSTGGGGYTDTDVDLHLNQASATEGQYLAWTGTDYGWVDSLDTRLKLSGANEGQILGWDGTDFVWTYASESPTDVLALVDFDVATVPEITDKSTYANEILFYLSSGDLASRFPDALLTEYDPKFGSGSLAISYDPFGLPVSLGSGDFCLEFWLRRDQYTGNKPIWSMSDPGGDNVILSLYLRTESNFPFGGDLGISARRSDGSTNWGTVYGTTNVSYTQWTHVAMYRIANVLYLGLNGTINTVTTGDRAEQDFSLSTEMAFGNRHPTHPNFSGNDRLGGGFDDIRVTVGSAVPYPAGAVGDTYDIPTEAHPVPGASSGGGGNDSRITDTQITNWDTAFGWGDHSTAGYLTEFTESDPTVPQHVKDITEAQITAWDSGTGGGAVDSVNGQTGVVVLTASDVGALPDDTVIPPAAPVDSVNGQTGEVVLTASDVGAIDTETDPTVPQHVKDITQAQIDAWDAGGGSGADSRISNEQITNWDEAHGWGDHAQAGYLTEFTESDPTVAEYIKAITQADIAAWNSAVGTGYTDADVDAHLNQSTATDGQILSYTSGDYSWIDAPSGGSTLAIDESGRSASHDWITLDGVDSNNDRIFYSSGTATTHTWRGGSAGGHQWEIGTNNQALTFYDGSDAVILKGTHREKGGLEGFRIDSQAFTTTNSVTYIAANGVDVIEARANGTLKLPTIPTADPSITDAVWADNGVLVKSGFTAPAGGGDDSRITNTQITNWDTAFGWGDHAQAGYLTDFTETDPTVPAWVKSITQEDIDAWNADPEAQTIVEIGAEPVSPNQGDLWLNDANSTVYIYDAGNWLEFPIGEAGEVMSSQVQLGEGGAFSLRLEGTEDLVTQADANKFIEAQLDALHNRIDTENNSLWEYTEAEQVIRPANDKNITSSSAVFGAMQSGTLAASTAAFTTVTVAETIQAEDFLDENGNSLIERSNALDALLQAEIAALVKELQAASAEIAEIVTNYDEQFASMEAALLALDPNEHVGEPAGKLKWATGTWAEGTNADTDAGQFKMHTDFTRVAMSWDTVSDGRHHWDTELAPYPRVVGLKMSGVMYWMEVEFIGVGGPSGRGKNFKILSSNLPTDAVVNELVEIIPDYKPATPAPAPDRIDGGSY